MSLQIQMLYQATVRALNLEKKISIFEKDYDRRVQDTASARTA
jgi:hypothetical protein